MSVQQFSCAGFVHATFVKSVSVGTHNVGFLDMK